jgi:hypothetical protein
MCGHPALAIFRIYRHLRDSRSPQTPANSPRLSLLGGSEDFPDERTVLRR